MRSTYMTSAIIAVAVLLWLSSGLLREPRPELPQTIIERNNMVSSQQSDRAPTRVRARVIHAKDTNRTITIRGQTQNKRTVVTRAQVPGTLMSRPVERGDIVQKGDLLCRLSEDDRPALLAEARDTVAQAEIEYEGSQRLSREGLQSETAIAQAKTRLTSAKARLMQTRLNSQRTRISAPFDGVVEDIHVNEGDYITPGRSCATVVDLDPMLVTGRVPEKLVDRFKPGGPATARLSTGVEVTGAITFVGRLSDPATRTYAFEVQIDNPDNRIPSGVTATIEVPTGRVTAQQVPPSVLALNDDGQLGVRAVDDDGVVEFHIIDVVNEDDYGVWVTGLPEVATVITVGQELVVHGEVVDVVLTDPLDTPSAERTSIGAL